MKTKCPYCSGECDDSGALVWKCPHCAKIVTCAAGSRNAPHEILRDIVAAFGEEILSDKAMFRNILCDAAPNIATMYRNLFCVAVENNIHDKLKHTDDTNAIKHRFADENGINRENADKIVDAFLFALGKIQTVSDGLPEDGSEAVAKENNTEIQQKEDDVYVEVNYDDDGKSKVWTNDIPQTLTFKKANSVCVSGDDIYVAKRGDFIIVLGKFFKH